SFTPPSCSFLSHHTPTTAIYPLSLHDALPIFTIARGEGAMVEDVDGNRYLDFMAGIAVASTGYGHPKVVQAIQEAAGRFLNSLEDRKSTRLNSSHVSISYAVFCLKKKNDERK